MSGCGPAAGRAPPQRSETRAQIG